MRRALAASPIFTVEALTLASLTRYCIMLVIALETHRVEIASIIRQPHGAWMLQVARDLLDIEGRLSREQALSPP